MKSLCIDLFVIDSMPLIATDCRNRICPLPTNKPYMRENYNENSETNTISCLSIIYSLCVCTCMLRTQYDMDL